jgi:hypothetical protein
MCFKTHKLTLWNTVIFEKLTVAQLDKNILVLYETLTFVTVFTRVHKIRGCL